MNAVAEIAEVEVAEIKVYLVPETNLGKLKDTIATLNKKAIKLGCEPILLTSEFSEVKHLIVHKKGKEHGYEWVSKEQLAHIPMGYVNIGEAMAFYAVTVSGKYPHYNGWKFVASMEAMVTKDGAAENIIKTVPGESCPHEFSLKIGCCDHCGHKRNRKKNYVLAHEAGEYKCVGSTCIADFLGGKSPEAYASQAEWLIAIDEACSDSEIYEGGGGSSPKGEVLESFLKVVSWVIDTNGWRSVSSCEFGGTSTMAWAVKIMNPHPFDPADVKDVRDQYYAADHSKHEAIAGAAIKWAESLADDVCEANTFMHNVRLIAKCEWVGNKNLGIAAWIVAGYLKHVEQLKEQERKAKLPPSQHVGEIKKRQVFKVECLAIYNSEGVYGVTGIHKMVTPEGAKLTWFASGEAEWLTVGSKYEIKATVIEHDEYKGEKQTTVNRVSIEYELDDNWEVVESLSLKEGELDQWSIKNPAATKLLKKYAKLNPEDSGSQSQKDLVCQIIDAIQCDEITLSWERKKVSKQEAKDYVMSFKSETVV